MEEIEPEGVEFNIEVEPSGAYAVAHERAREALDAIAGLSLGVIETRWHLEACHHLRQAMRAIGDASEAREAGL